MTVELGFGIELFPSDLDRFVDFYVRVLRFTLVDDRRNGLPPYVAVERGASRIGASLPWLAVDSLARKVPQGTELVFEPSDVVAERDAIVSAGWPLAADLTRQPWGLDDFRLFDPDGYYLRFTSTRRSMHSSGPSRRAATPRGRP